MFVFSRGMKLQIWHQVLDMVALCFLCPFCILPSEKQMSKKCRNVKDLGNSVQQWLHLCCKVFNFIIQMSSRFFSLYLSSSLSMLVSVKYFRHTLKVKDKSHVFCKFLSNQFSWKCLLKVTRRAFWFHTVL